MTLPTFTWDVDPILFHYPEWLPLPGGGIRYYSLLYMLVFLGGYKLLDWQIKRAGGKEEDASDFITYGVIAVLGGARFGHVFFYEWDRLVETFTDDPTWILRIWEGGLASHGATIGLILAMWLFTKRRNQSFVEGCDRFSFAAALGAILVRVGNWFNSEIVGRHTDGTWGVMFPRFDGYTAPPLRHPSQLYEVFLGCVVFAALYIADRAFGKEKRPRGLLISIFFTLYFMGRFLVEYFKEHQSDGLAMEAHDILEGPLTTGQLLSIPLVIAGLIGITVSLVRKTPAHWYVPARDDAPAAEAAKATAKLSSNSTSHAEEEDEGNFDDDVDAVLAGEDDHLPLDTEVGAESEGSNEK